MKIRSIKIQGMHNVIQKTYEFSDINYIHGLNGSGKTTILQSIQLALLGYIPGTNKSNSAIMLHANGNQMSVTLSLEEKGSIISISRTFTKVRSSVTSEVSTYPENLDIQSIIRDIELPIFNWSEFLSLSSNKMKDWFIKFLPSGSSDIDWYRVLSESISEDISCSSNYISEYVSNISDIPHTSSIDWCIKTNSLIKDDISYTKKLLDEKKKSVNTLIRYEDSDIPGTSGGMEKYIEDLRTQINDNNVKLDNMNENIREYESVEKHNSNIRWYISETQKHILSDEDIQKKKYNIDSMNEECNSLNLEVNKIRSDIKFMKSEIESRNFDSNIQDIRINISKISDILDSSGTCPYTRDHCDIIETKREDAETKYKEYHSRLESLYSEKKNLESNLNKLISDLEVKSERISKLRNDISNFSIELEKQDQLHKDVKDLESKIKTTEYTYEQYKSWKLEAENLPKKLADISSKITKAESNIRYNNLIDQVTKEKYELENHLECLKIWSKVTGENGIQTEISEAPFQDMQDSMNMYLNKVFSTDITCKFVLSSKSNSFSFGIIRDEMYIPYETLSNGEKTLYSFALMLYLVENSGSDLHLILMDDFLDHLDDMRLESLLNILSDSDFDVQIVMAGVKECKEENINLIEISR